MIELKEKYVNFDDLKMTSTYCYICKGQVNTTEEIKKKPYKRKIWKCTLCGTILGSRGVK